jgi:hypothetical protein
MNDFKHKEDVGHYKDIIDCIQDRIDVLVKDKYGHDECYPDYKVSILWKNKETQEIILNCTHLGSTFSRVIFPVQENFWGYDWLGEMIESLYNQTM